jgi:hypothetical protein
MQAAELEVVDSTSTTRQVTLEFPAVMDNRFNIDNVNDIDQIKNVLDALAQYLSLVLQNAVVQPAITGGTQLFAEPEVFRVRRSGILNLVTWTLTSDLQTDLEQ